MSDLANKPSQNGYAKIAYNVFTDMDNGWLTASELFQLMPSASKADKKAWSKMKTALGNGVDRGLFVFVGDQAGFADTRKFRIASKTHQSARLKQYYKKYPTTIRKVKKDTKTERLNGTSELVKFLDAEIEKAEERLARLERMRNDALTL